MVNDATVSATDDADDAPTHAAPLARLLTGHGGPE
jgi:hypothetical protein